MLPNVDSIEAMEILDSRGNPTVQVRVRLDNGLTAASSVPSGASTGAQEAFELRDGDPGRYHGKGVLKAVENVRRVIAPGLVGRPLPPQRELDTRLLELDGTDNKSRLGANAILGVSQACARAAAKSSGMPLYRYLADAVPARIPMPMFNVINGGKHADSGLDVQEFMLVPVGAPSFAEAMRYAAETVEALQGLLRMRGYTTSVGDEGGFAPMLEHNEDAFDVILEAIDAAGYRAGTDIAIAIDAAATSFAVDGKYRLSRTSYRDKTSSDMVDLYASWLEKYPLISIEDPLSESDWPGFIELTRRIGDRVQVVGDDILVTNTRFIRQAIEQHACNAALIKLNQIGTVSETIDAVELCRKAGWRFVISHRSGETPDAFMADFAVAMGASQMKAGSVRRGERLAKYNRLLEIERELGTDARFGW